MTDVATRYPGTYSLFRGLLARMGSHPLRHLFPCFLAFIAYIKNKGKAMYRIIAAIIAIPLLFAGVLAQPVAFDYSPLPETSFCRPHIRNGVGDIADFADLFGIKNNNPDDYPVINYYCPDTNFISHGFAYHSVPDEQVLVGNHLYVARGAYFVIYEIGANGYLTEIGRKPVTHSLLWEKSKIAIWFYFPHTSISGTFPSSASMPTPKLFAP